MIEVLSTFQEFASHVRRRPGMYLGDIGHFGYANLVESVLYKLVRLGGGMTRIEISLYPGNRISIRATGIDVHAYKDFVGCTKENTYELGEIWLAAFIALGAELDIQINENGRLYSCHCEQGGLGFEEMQEIAADGEEEFVALDHTLDAEIFTEFVHSYVFLLATFEKLAVLNPGLTIVAEDRTSKEIQRLVFHFPNGVFDLLDSHIRMFRAWEIFHRVDICETIQGYDYRIGVCFSRSYLGQPLFRTFAGMDETIQGCSLNQGILDGLRLAIKDYALKHEIKVQIKTKELLDKIHVIAAVSGGEFLHRGGIRNGLGMPGLRRDVKQLVAAHMTAYFEANPEFGHAFVEWFEIHEWPPIFT